MSDEKRRLPAWLVGLLVAVVVSAIALLVLDALGYGDDPSLGMARLLPEHHVGGGIGLPLQSMPSSGR